MEFVEITLQRSSGDDYDSHSKSGDLEYRTTWYDLSSLQIIAVRLKAYLF